MSKESVIKKRLQWLVHVNRVSRTGISRTLQQKLEGKRPVGRSRTRWLNRREEKKGMGRKYCGKNSQMNNSPPWTLNQRKQYVTRKSIENVKQKKLHFYALFRTQIRKEEARSRRLEDNINETMKEICCYVTQDHAQ